MLATLDIHHKSQAPLVLLSLDVRGWDKKKGRENGKIAHSIVRLYR